MKRSKDSLKNLQAEGLMDPAKNQNPILIVDDAPDNLFITKKILQTLGYNSITAEDGKEAVTLTKKEKPSLILMDCNLPGINGFQASSQIREIEQEQNREAIPIIALTAHVSDEVYQQCLDAGMNDRLVKPLNIEKLKELLKKYLAKGA